MLPWATKTLGKEKLFSIVFNPDANCGDASICLALGGGSATCNDLCA
jgi:hypothetical protein